eukprot:CAMPEP_0168214774 /NCGR_PEP_ID=MMETSP0140_2-20121125/5535_1 /TAXON_ID=44445 /ORGANISM="Pseudo-nitzschia australis, Strain 10249 10 AB" /LENGTH=669 /DNA_ID=CAMNT_0008141769 /DNA_START=114 /DNA_END=2123 /DNA_ORIENTATION=+
MELIRGPKFRRLQQRRVLSSSPESSSPTRSLSLFLPKKKKAFLCSFLLALVQLPIDPLFSFTAIPTRRIASAASRRSSSSTTTSLLMTRRRRTNRDFFNDVDDEYNNSNNENENNDQVDGYYYEKVEEESVNDYNYDDYDYDDYYNSSSYYEEDGNRKGNSRRRRVDLDVDYYDEDGDDEYADTTTSYRSQSQNSNNNDSFGSSSSSISGSSRGGYYQVSFNNNDEIDPAETEIDWEICSNNNNNGKKIPQALVLLPPAAVDRPKAIVHFVGGTVFGSNPKLWYKGLLEGIVRSTSVAIVVTPIPVTLFQNPLQHVRLSQALRSSFCNAWETVLNDEYGPEALEGIPLCGLGHSLGARLLTVMTTLDKNEPVYCNDDDDYDDNFDDDDEAAKRQTTRIKIPPYKSLCLVSFTNYGAKVGIPGVGALLKQSKKREAYNNNRGIDANGNGASSPRSRRNQSRGMNKNSRNRNGNRYDDDEYYDNDNDNIDEEWAEMVEELQETVNEQANRIQTALTPNSKELEFFPTPDQLWKALSNSKPKNSISASTGGGGRYRVNTTLVVQFDDDPIDQGSKLASLLHSTNSSDVRFARLRGNHLTPVSGADGEGSSSAGAAAPLPRQQKQQQRQQLDVGLQSLLEKTFKGTQRNRRDKVALRDLRLSLVSYITDVVTK